MLERVENLKSQVEATSLTNKEEAEIFRLQYLSKKGSIQELFTAFREVPADEKKAFGAALNTLKNLAEAKHKGALEELESTTVLAILLLYFLTYRILLQEIPRVVEPLGDPLGYPFVLGFR